MTIKELIGRLTQIAIEAGPDLPVCHHDDWDFFVVDVVEMRPAQDGEPAHVAISGDDTRACELPGGAEHR
jgi:hypothetical protein